MFDTCKNVIQRLAKKKSQKLLLFCHHCLSTSLSLAKLKNIAQHKLKTQTKTNHIEIPNPDQLKTDAFALRRPIVL